METSGPLYQDKNEQDQPIARPHVDRSSHSEATDLPSAQETTTQSDRVSGAPWFLGIFIWIGVSTLFFMFTYLPSHNDFGLQALFFEAEVWFAFLLLTSPFLAGYYLRGKRSRLGCLGLFILGSIGVFFAVRSVLDEARTIKEGMLIVVIVALIAIWVVVGVSLVLGALAQAAVHRIYRHR